MEKIGEEQNDNIDVTSVSINDFMFFIFRKCYIKWDPEGKIYDLKKGIKNHDVAIQMGNT